MAVVDIYVDPNQQGTAFPKKQTQTQRAQGANRSFMLIQSFTLAAGDSDGSVYRIFQSISSELLIHELLVANDAMAGFTSCSVGLHRSQGGAAVSAALFATNLDLSAAHNSFIHGTALNGMVNIVPQTPTTIDGVSVGKCNQRLFELAGQSVRAGTRMPDFDLTFTATTRGAAGGNVAVWALVSQG